MDGNARWARSRGLPVLAGHSAGTRALRRTVEACLDLGVDSLAVFAFSTENWNRPDDEVRGLLDLLAETIKREFPDMGRMGVRVRFVGPARPLLAGDPAADRGHRARHGRERAPSRSGSASTTAAAPSSSRRRARSCATASRPRTSTRRRSRRACSAPDMPEPDLVIRTSGEQRLSNFLLWQTAYSEYVFLPTLWPDFGEGAAARARWPSTRAGAGASGRDERPPRPRARRRHCSRRVALGCVWVGGVAMLAARAGRRRRSRWTSSSAWRARCGRSR